MCISLEKKNQMCVSHIFVRLLVINERTIQKQINLNFPYDIFAEGKFCNARIYLQNRFSDLGRWNLDYSSP